MSNKKIPPLSSGHYAPVVQEKLEHYSPMLQGPATNTLAFSNTRKGAFNIDFIANTASTKQGNITIFLDAYNEITGACVPLLKRF